MTESALVASKGRCQKKADAKEKSKEADSFLIDIETFSDSDSGEFGEATQGSLNSIEGLLSRFPGSAMSIIESTSSMVFEEMVYGVCHETEPPSC